MCWMERKILCFMEIGDIKGPGGGVGSPSSSAANYLTLWPQLLSEMNDLNIRQHRYKKLVKYRKKLPENMGVKILSAALTPMTRWGVRHVCFSFLRRHKSSVVVGRNIYENDLNEQMLDLFYISVVKHVGKLHFLN